MKRTKHRLISAILAVLTLTSLPILLIFSTLGNAMPFTGKAAEYCEELMEDGFPQDYAVALTKLHLVHPAWSFVPLNVTGTNASYTWNYVIDKETATPTMNLVSKQDAYRDYWHPINRQTYDSGYYQPSADTVRYFMDPRNFLNEADIFQFYDLSDGLIASQDAIDAVLAGSFMENAQLSNGKTYTEYLMEIGEEIGIDAVYLAVKLRQEQGANGTSPIISGTCGNVLLSFYREQKQVTDGGSPINPPAPGEADEAELEALNGLYNPFNVGATGNGVFAIYQGAMKYAQRGSASMTETWDGSPSWDTDWKGIYGGALFIKEKYIDRYQSTIYLQKFDVDGRNPNGNFKNQYMQNIFGALSEGRSFYRAFASNDTLDTDCQFLIPIYTGMPAEICADPANGSCPAFAPASKGYETTAEISHPKRLRQFNDAVYGELTVKADEPLEITGEFSHSYGINRLEYSFDGVEWLPCSDSGLLDLSISEDLPDYGEYLLLIRGEAAYDSNDGNKKLNRYFLCAAFHLTLLPPPTLTLTLQAGNVLSDEKKYYEGESVTLPVSDAPNFVGWFGSDGTVLPSGGTLIMKNDVQYVARFADLQALEGAALSLSSDATHLRFTAVIPNDQFLAFGDHADFSATLTQNGVQTEVSALHTDQTVTGASGRVWRKITADTPTIGIAQYADLFEVKFQLHIRYSDGTEKTILATGDSFPRSAQMVAQAALEDRSVTYSAPSIGFLNSILSQSPFQPNP